MRLIRGGTVFVNGELARLDIAFDEDGIHELAPQIDVDAEDVIDASGHIILPGIVDAHVHIRDFNESRKETWLTAGQAALAGGVTAVLAMPNTDPPITTVEMIREQRRRAQATPIDYGLFAGISPDKLSEVPRLARERGIIGFKLYMGETTGGLVIGDPKTQREAFKRVADTELVLAVHAQRLGSSSEAADLETALEHAVQTGTKLHLCHVRTQAGVELADEARDDGIDVTIETCPHYLVFSADDVRQKGPRLKVNPPLATPEDRDFLWHALADGIIDIVASDHAPHTLHEKGPPFGQAPFGLPGLETTMPILLDGVSRHRLSLGRLVECVSSKPADRFDLPHHGTIAEDRPARLTIVDPQSQRQFSDAVVRSRCGWTPYDGLSFQGQIANTVVAGAYA
ncbi:MAG: dihydroorotase family protein [Candidatus Bipolaricaulia bacterium]